jgi:hypothetical protein
MQSVWLRIQLTVHPGIHDRHKFIEVLGGRRAVINCQIFHWNLQEREPRIRCCAKSRVYSRIVQWWLRLWFYSHLKLLQIGDGLVTYRRWRRGSLRLPLGSTTASLVACESPVLRGTHANTSSTKCRTALRQIRTNYRARVPHGFVLAPIALAVPRPDRPDSVSAAFVRLWLARARGCAAARLPPAKAVSSRWRWRWRRRRRRRKRSRSRRRRQRRMQRRRLSSGSSSSVRSLCWQRRWQ